MEALKHGNSSPHVSSCCLDVVPPENNCSDAEELERTTSTYSENCEEMDPEYAERLCLETFSNKVGTNHLIVEKVLYHCDIRTMQQCCLVNHLWRSLTLKYVKLHFDDRYVCGDYDLTDTRLDMKEVLRNKSEIPPYHCIQIEYLRPTSNWKQYSPNLKVLILQYAEFRKMDDVYRVVFDSFPNMQELNLDGVEVKKDPNEDAPLKDYHVATPKLQKLIIGGCGCKFPILNADFCFKVITKLRNLRELTFYGSKVHQEIPIFQALTRGNIQLGALEYYPVDCRVESSAIINNYLRSYGESLRFIEGYFLGNSFQDMFHGYVGKNLKCMKVRWADYRCTFRGQFPNLKKIVFDYYHLESGERFPEPSTEPRILSVREVSLGKCLRHAKRTDEDRQREWEDIFKMFPNMTTLSVCNMKQSDVLDVLNVAVLHLPKLEHIKIVDWSGSEWREVTTHIALNFAELKSLHFEDESEVLHVTDLLPLVLLPKLHTLRVDNAEIPRRLFELLKNQVPNLIIPKLRIHQ